MSANLPIPRGISFPYWAAVFTEQFAGEPPAIPTTEAEWREWATALLQLNPFVELPDPAAHSGWTLWAEEVINVLWNQS